MNNIYLVVMPRGGLTSEERAEAISRELYNIRLPKALHEPDRVTTKLLGTMQHASGTGEWALVAQEGMTIRVHPDHNLDALIALFPQLTQEEIDTRTAYIQSNNEIALENLFPSTATVLTQQEAEDAGWINTDVI